MKSAFCQYCGNFFKVIADDYICVDCRKIKNFMEVYVTESERKQFLLLQGRVLALESRLERFEKFWGWKEQDKPSDEDIKAYIFGGVKEAK
ncbi:MAG: hypothetical protein WA066_02825 [Candidatus Omnitrophota bacterium]